MRPSFSAFIPLALSSVKSFAFTPSNSGRARSTARFVMSNTAAANYPRPLHPGGFSLPPLVEDLLPIMTQYEDTNGKEATVRSDLILIRPPGMEELWEWYAYTKRQSECDPSWGRVWPTALSMARFIRRSFQSDSATADVDLVNQAVDALKTSSHVVELGCGLGLAGLAYSSAINSLDGKSPLACKRTVTFLDREPYALHCVMSSAAMNNLTTAPLAPHDDQSDSSNGSLITVRASMDDWTISNESQEGEKQQIRNIGYNELCLGSSEYNNQDTTILATDILYEPSSMETLATKIKSLLHQEHGGFAIISDPKEERTEGCRDAFVSTVKGLGGDIAIMPLPAPQSNVGMTESDIDINGSLASTVLIVVHFPASNV